MAFVTMTLKKQPVAELLSTQTLNVSSFEKSEDHFFIIQEL